MTIETEYEYFIKKVPKRIYVSSSFPERYPIDPSRPRNKRIISAVIEKEPFDEFVTVTDQLILRRGPKGQQELKIVVYEDEREIENIIIQHFFIANGKPKKYCINLSKEEYTKLLNVILYIRNADFSKPDKAKLLDSEMEFSFDDIDPLLSIVKGDDQIIKTILENTVTSRDLVSIAYRKKQIEKFEQMLKERSAREPEWQNFFEENRWIFGYGLNYIFSTGLDGKKLEQTVAGHTFLGHGKRTDALLKTAGYINTLCLVEIKTPQASLVKKANYRVGVWQPGDDVVGGVSQIQKTVSEMKSWIQSRIPIFDDVGDPTTEIIYTYEPKSFLVVGCLDEFITEHGVNEDKYGSFQLFRRNLHNPEIITYDELLERAKYIVASKSESVIKDDYSENEEEDIPF